MGWVWLDDQFSQHEKVAPLSGDAGMLFVASLCYSNRTLSDGFIPSKVAMGQLWFCDGNPIPSIRELEASDLWERVQGGWQVHDFADYQQTRAQAEARRAVLQQARVRGGRRGGRSRVQQATRDESGRFLQTELAGESRGDQTASRVDSTLHPDPTPTPTPTGVQIEGSPGSSNSSIAPRKRDAIWDGFAEWLKREPETKTERGKWNAAAKQLREIGVDSADDVAARGRRYEQADPGIVPTPLGLVGHWSELNGSPPKEEQSDPDWMFKFMGEEPDVR